MHPSPSLGAALYLQFFHVRTLVLIDDRHTLAPFSTPLRLTELLFRPASSTDRCRCCCADAAVQIFFSGHGDPIKAAAILHKVKVHFLGPGQSPQLVEEERRAPNGKTTVVPLPGFIW